jgi:hypothetical protein
MGGEGERERDRDRDREREKREEGREGGKGKSEEGLGFIFNIFHFPTLLSNHESHHLLIAPQAGVQASNA